MAQRRATRGKPISTKAGFGISPVDQLVDRAKVHETAWRTFGYESGMDLVEYVIRELRREMGA